MIINGKDAVMGRLASQVAKEILKGENIVVVNADRIIIAGEPTRIMQRLNEKTQRGYPTKGPFYPKFPDKMFIRVVRGMIPYKTERGRKALKRLKVFRSCPDQYKEAEEAVKNLKDIKCKYMRLEDISRKLGAHI